VKKILSSLLLIGTTLIITIGLSSAFFSDTETSKDNILQAGELDLKIDNQSYLNGQKNDSTSWELDDLKNKLFFNFTDLKPDDFGEDTISIHAANDYWACMEISITKNDDNTCTEPEKIDDPNCNEPNNNDFDGELGNLVNFVWWPDDGDNVLEDNETPFINVSSASAALNQKITLSDASKNLWGQTGPLSPSQTYYIGKAWCFGNLGLAPLKQDGSGNNRNPSLDNDGQNGPGKPEDGGITCDGTALNNASQTDSLMGDISFSAYQARHNPDFTCAGTTPTPTSTITPTPTPIACNQADVMLVLDRSGSINATELTDLKTAATTFVNALGLSTTGIHAGMTSFATFGTLNHHLTDNSASLIAAINALTSGGFTNLKDGLDLSMAEHANPGDGHDRPDFTSPDKVIVITDGHPNRPLPSSTAPSLAKASADASRLAGAEIFVVGVGSDVNQAYLETIADDSGHYYSVSDYSGLETLLENLDLCQ